MTTTLTANAQTIYAAFSDDEQAQKAAGALLDHGVWAEDLSIIAAKGTPEYYRECENESTLRDKATGGITTTTAGDAEKGAAKGAGLGLGIGALAAVASLFVPGVGLVTGGGALAMAIGGAAGATAAGAIAGGVEGYLKDQGVPDEAIGRYAEAFNNGDTLVAVTLPSNDVSSIEADEVLRKYNGKHISAY